MKYAHLKYILFSGILGITGCSMVVSPPDQIATENYWKTENDAYLALNACYAQMPGMDIWDEMSTDNAHSHKPWEGPYELIQQNGISTENDLGYGFSDIRIFNNFLEKVDMVQVSDELKARMKAEVRFLRAFSYLNLTTKFGKIPLITQTLDYDAPNVKRNSIEEVRQFILDELKAISEVLPPRYNGGLLQEKGRITKGAALALRARAALYFGNYKEAEKSAQEVVDLGIYTLFTINTLNASQQKEADEMEQFIDFDEKGINKADFIKGLFSYESLWHAANANPSNPEYILTREYMGDDNNNDWTRYTYIRPSQLKSGYSSFEPMQDLVDAYWDIDGKSLRTTSMKDRETAFASITSKIVDLDQVAYINKIPTMELKNEPYIQEFRNRDTRLYASILFPFKGWHETDFGTFYYRWNPKWAATNGNESWTGYSYRKLVSLTPYQDWASIEDYPTIRYAEVLLTLAEARIKNSGWDQTVVTSLNKLRDRVGMPSVPLSLSPQEAIDFVRNERRIELAGEGHRYDDIRRYGEEYASKVMTGTTYAPNGYSVVNKQWNNRLILMPIPQNAMDLNPLLKEDQNPGY